jgi:hypothetical protein
MEIGLVVGEKVVGIGAGAYAFTRDASLPPLRHRLRPVHPTLHHVIDNSSAPRRGPGARVGQPGKGRGDLQGRPEHARRCARVLAPPAPGSHALGVDGSKTDDSARERQTRDQETALVKLGELYRDQKCAVPISVRRVCVLKCIQEREGHRGGHHDLALVHVVHCEGEDREAQCVARVTATDAS